MWFIVGIVGVSMIVPITKLITIHLQTMAKIKGDLIQSEIELEKLKQQNYIIETEKMKLELKKMQLDYEPEKIELSKV